MAISSRVLSLVLLGTTTIGCGAFVRQQKLHDQCKLHVDQSMRVPHTPPHHGLGGVWHCRYNAVSGEAISEKDTYAISGDRVTVSGRDNYGGNLVGDGFAGGDEMTLRFGETSSRKLRLVSPALLDGTLIFWDDRQCFEGRVTCTR